MAKQNSLARPVKDLLDLITANVALFANSSTGCEPLVVTAFNPHKEQYRYYALVIDRSRSNVEERVEGTYAGSSHVLVRGPNAKSDNAALEGLLMKTQYLMHFAASPHGTQAQTPATTNTWPYPQTDDRSTVRNDSPGSPSRPFTQRPDLDGMNGVGRQGNAAPGSAGFSPTSPIAGPRPMVAQNVFIPQMSNAYSQAQGPYGQAQNLSPPYSAQSYGPDAVAPSPRTFWSRIQNQAQPIGQPQGMTVPGPHMVPSPIFPPSPTMQHPAGPLYGQPVGSPPPGPYVMGPSRGPQVVFTQPAPPVIFTDPSQHMNGSPVGGP